MKSPSYDVCVIISRDGFKHVFMIPPDFDDTFVNLGLGALLAEIKQDYPASYDQWMSQNTNITSVYDALKKYAYRPMTEKDAVNSIDCRTYFYLRFFLEKEMKNKEDIALVPTWVGSKLISKGASCICVNIAG